MINFELVNDLPITWGGDMKEVSRYDSVKSAVLDCVDEGGLAGREELEGLPVQFRGNLPSKKTGQT